MDMLYYIKQRNIPITLTVVVDGLVQVVPVALQEKSERRVRGSSRQLYFCDHFIHGTSTVWCLSFTCTSLKQIDSPRYNTCIAIYVKGITEEEEEESETEDLLDKCWPRRNNDCRGDVCRACSMVAPSNDCKGRHSSL